MLQSDPIEIRCTNCKRPYPEEGTPFNCPVCGGLYDYSSIPIYDPARVDANCTGLWRYRYTFGLPEHAPLVSLGEGDTPLVWQQAFGHRVAFKLEYKNPTGSFKDRGAAILVSFLRSRGVTNAVEDSSGNAGASFAAYARRTGLEAKVYVPEYASGPKRKQIEEYNAQLVSIPGLRSKTSEAVLRAAKLGAVYASHAYFPQSLVGMATVAYELLSQLGQTPGTVICPVGQGSLLLGIGRGFLAMKQAGLVDFIPKLVGVQALACAPLWAVFHYGPAGLQWVSEGETLAEGVRIKYPLRGDTLLQTVKDSKGLLIAVAEEEILPGRDELYRLGFFVEPTSAIVWNALEQVVGQMPEPIVAVLTGAGFKSSLPPPE
jgi:threonine synthase